MGIAVLSLLVVITIQGGQRLQRGRSERLLHQLQAVDLRVTTFADVERSFGRRATKSEKCDSSACDYTIQLKSFLTWEILNRVSQYLHMPSRPILHTLLRLGARPALVNAHIAIRNGTAWGKGMTIVVTAPGQQDEQGHWSDYELVGRAGSVSGFHHGSSEAFQSELLHHPDYVIGRPGGCDGPCVEGYVLFTPYAATEDVRRLMQFDLSCLTRWWHPCRTQADILPSAWAQYEQEQKLPTSGPTWRSNPRLVEILGRDASAVAILQVIRIDRQEEPSQYVLQGNRVQPTGKMYVLQWATAHVLLVLKGGLWREGENTTLQASQHELRLYNSERLIVLLDPIWTEKAAAAFDVLPWQVLPPTLENLARVRTGIAEDFENSTLNK